MAKTEWTIATLKEYVDALREADQRALRIKEEGDKEALRLAREIQTYKDEKANELREQINSERGLYVTKTEFEPVKTYIASQTGRGVGMSALAGWAVSIVTAGIAIAVYLK